MTPCASYRQQLSEYLDNALTPQARLRLEGHLGACADCRADLESLQHLVRALRTMDQPVTPELLPGIHRNLAQRVWWKEIAKEFLVPWPNSLPLHGVAVAVIAFFAVFIATLPTVFKGTEEIEQRLQYASNTLDRFIKVSESKAQSGGAFHQLASMPSARRHAEISAKQSQLESRRDQSATRATTLNKLNSNDQARQRAGGKDLAGKAGQVATSEPVRLERAIEKQERAKVAEDREAVLDKAVALNRAVGSASLALAKALPAEGVVVGAIATPPSVQASNGTAPGYVPLQAPISETVPEPLHFQWAVDNFKAAIPEVSEWVKSKNGLVYTIDRRHLLMTLPLSDIPAFLKRFPSRAPESDRAAQRLASSTPPQGKDGEPAHLSRASSETAADSSPAPSIWVTVWLELVPSQ